jgi:hypothetical protein
MELSDIDIFKEVKLNSWDELKRRLIELSNDYYFRGQTSSEWNLTTSLERLSPKSPSIAERNMLDSFGRNIYNLDIPRKPESNLETLMFLQHYGAPTRLVDFTKSPYVASFFALNRKIEGESAIYVINGGMLFHKLATYYESDFVIFFDAKKVRSIEIDNELNKPRVFDELFLSNKNINFISVMNPLYHHERSNPQSSIHIAVGNIKVSFLENFKSLIDKSDTEFDIEPLAIKFTFPNSIREEALSELGLMNINYSGLFPGLEGFVRDLYLDYERMTFDQKAFLKKYLE